jgi:hypothetical protein
MAELKPDVFAFLARCFDVPDVLGKEKGKSI